MRKKLPNWVTIAGRQLRSLRAEKTILLAIMIQLIVAGFSSFLVVGLVSLYDPSGVEQGQEIAVGITGDKGVDVLTSIDGQNNGVQVEYYTDPDEAFDDFQQGEINGYINANVNDNQQVEAILTAPDEGVQSTLTVVRMQNILTNFERDQRQRIAVEENINTLQLEKTTDTPPYVSFTYTVLIPLLLFLPAFISGAIVIDTIIQDRKQGVIELLQSTPTTDKDIIIGKLLVPALIGPLQIIAWLFLLTLNDVSIYKPSFIVAIGTGLTLIAVSTAAYITQYTNNRGSAQFIYSGTLVFLISLATLLPEIPITTIAKFGLGSYDITSIILAAVYLVAGVMLSIFVLRNYSLQLVNEEKTVE